MSCVFCGGGDSWIKTCRLGSERVRVCDPCWEITRLVIVSGPVVLYGKCSRCGSWEHLRELENIRPGGKWDAPSGLCRMCLDA